MASVARSGCVAVLAALACAVGASNAVAVTPAPTAVLSIPSGTIVPNAPIHFDGSKSFAINPATIVSYRWTVGPHAVVVKAASDGPTFDDPGLTPGTYQVSLVVVDSNGNQSAADTKQITVATDHFAPTAVLQAPTSVVPGAAIHLVGSKSFDVGGGSVIEYRWTVGTRPVFVTSDPTFDAPGLGVGIYQVSLVVVDSSDNVSAPTSAQITVGDPFAPTPVIEAPATVSAGLPIHLVGSKSFDVGGGSVVQYRWTVGTQPIFVTSDPTFDAPGLGVGVYQVTLVVVDDSGNESAPTSVQIHVVDTSNPTAVLDGPGSVVTGTAIHFTAFKSFDVGGSVVQYRWTVAGRATVVTSSPSFDAPSLGAGTYQASLVVVDDSGNQSSPTTRTFSVTPNATPVTTFGKITLFAPVNKKTSQIFLRTRTLLAGRVFAPTAGRLSATFSLKRGAKLLRLGSTSLSLNAGDVKQLKIKLGSSCAEGAARPPQGQDRHPRLDQGRHQQHAADRHPQRDVHGQPVARRVVPRRRHQGARHHQRSRSARGLGLAEGGGGRPAVEVLGGDRAPVGTRA